MSDTQSVNDRIARVRAWLEESAIPLWYKQGFDPVTGSFAEALSKGGEALPLARRAMVQARQIYSFCEASRLGLLSAETARHLVAAASASMIERYSLPSGAFMHSVSPEGVPVSRDPDLYAQSFALFALAHAFDLTAELSLRTRALALLAYLQRERSLANGGFGELVAGRLAFEANPHMHLFEATLAWMRVDGAKEWLDLGSSIDQLCRSRFIDSKSGALAEHFDENWSPVRESGCFVFEPGHQYEWAWLLLEYAELRGVSAGVEPARLFALSEAHGLRAGMVVDELWSDFRMRKASSRFWPQSERIKAALSMRNGAAADQAVDALFRFFAPPLAPGLWEDTLDEHGRFVEQPVKASSLYHVICALSEYLHKRQALAH